MQPLSWLPIHSITPIPWQVKPCSPLKPKNLLDLRFRFLATVCFLAFFFMQQQQEQCAGKFKQLPLALAFDQSSALSPYQHCTSGPRANNLAE